MIRNSNDSLLGVSRDAALREGQVVTQVIQEAERDLTVGMPVLLGLLGLATGIAASAAFARILLTISIPLLIVLSLLFVLMSGYFFRRFAQLKRTRVSGTEFYFQLEALESSHRVLAAELEATNAYYANWHVLLVTIDALTARFVRGVLARGTTSEQEIRQAVETVLEVIAKAREGCLRFKAGDHSYNLHLFRWDPAVEELTTFARVSGSKISRNNRQWRAREGHAGHCFDLAKSLYLTDLQNSEGAAYRRRDLPNDKSVYRSILDIPVPQHWEVGPREFIDASAPVENIPWGVLTVTSGTPEQFRQLDFIPLQSVAQNLGTIVATTRLMQRAELGTATSVQPSVDQQERP